MSKFKVGDVVRWGSQAQGSYRDKVGIIFYVVPPNESMNKTKAQEELSRQFRDQATWGTDFSGLPRKQESYLVVVPGSIRRLPRVYWPRTSALRPGTLDALT